MHHCKAGQLKEHEDLLADAWACRTKPHSCGNHPPKRIGSGPPQVQDAWYTNACTVEGLTMAYHNDGKSLSMVTWSRQGLAGARDKHMERGCGTCLALGIQHH